MLSDSSQMCKYKIVKTQNANKIYINWWRDNFGEIWRSLVRSELITVKILDVGEEKFKNNQIRAM